MLNLLLLIGCCLTIKAVAGAVPPRLQRQHFNQLLSRTAQTPVGDVDPLALYPAHNFSVPIDHFQDKDDYQPHSNGSFPLRYWFDATYYKPGGPVFVLAAGETSGEDRLPFLQKGIIYQMAKATNGLGVILEHRYYGTSFPVPDLSVENLRFLTTEQALADTAYFADNIVFPGLEQEELTSSDTAWIAYGGSYAGAFVAFLRTQYPNSFWGAVSSSGVTEAIIDYWQYWENIRLFGPTDCIAFTQDLVEVLDGILMNEKKEHLADTLKAAFGLPNITSDTDFAITLTNNGVGGWQGRNWDPAITDNGFEQYCSNVSNTSVLYPGTETLRTTMVNLTEEADFAGGSKQFINQILNFVGWANTTIVQPCAQGNQTQDQCFGTNNDTYYQLDGLDKYAVRSWTWQYCTQWGYFQTSDAPADVRTIQSRLVDLPYSSKICKQAFNITDLPDVEAINKYGGFGIEYDRLAIVDGQQDPWEYATPHAPSIKPSRENTINKPFIEIEGAVHHWDENGLFPNETTASLPPAPVKDAQEQIVHAVQEWVKEYDHKCRYMNACG